MSGAQWATVLAALLSGGLVAALLDWWRDRRREPITVRDAHVAAADTLQEMSLRVAAAADERAERTAKRVSDLQAARESDSARIASLERHATQQDHAIARLERTVGRWVRWYADLVDRWEHVRTQANPPPAPADPTDPTP